METGKRSKNFTEKEKMFLIEIAKEYSYIIDNKKTDGPNIEAKKQAWTTLTCKFNAVSETGMRTEKQLHALYDNIKKKARKNSSEDKSEMYKTVGGTFYPETTGLDEKIVALLTPELKLLSNEYDSSASYYKSDTQQTQVIEDQSNQPYGQSNVVSEVQSVFKRCISSPLEDIASAQQIKERKGNLYEIKKKNINNLSASIMKRKNNDIISKKKLEILKIQLKQESMKLEKTKILFDLDIELKKTLLENAKMDLEIKKKSLNL